MRVLFITRGYPAENRIMLGNYESIQARAIAAKGHSVSVLAVRWRSLAHFYECGKLKHRKDGDINVYECTRVYTFIPGISFGIMRRFERYIRKSVFSRILKVYLEKEQMPDIVHAHIVSYAAPASILKERYGIPFVITEHWSKTNVGNITERVKGDSFVYHAADVIICVSEALSRSLRDNFGVESVVIPNMVDKRFFENYSEPGKHEGLRFISVGNLLPIKGYDILIKAFAKVDRTDVTLDIVGGGPEKEHLQSLINKNRLQDRVKLLGLKTPDEVGRYMSQSDCLVLSSRSETFGIVIIEAMAKGLPVIATQCGGPETIINADNGITVPVGDIDALSGAIEFMIGHAAQFNRKAIRQKCIECYSEETIADKIIDVYNKVLMS